LNSSLLPTEWTTSNFASVFHTIALGGMLQNSWVSAVGAALTAVIIATPAAYFTARRFRGERLLTALLASYCAPSLVAIILVFFLSYNDFLFAVYLAVTKESQTLTVGLSLFQGDRNVQFGQQAAAGLMGIAPVYVLALVAQRYLVGGLTTGATK